MTAWERFEREKLTQIFTEKNLIIDIGGDLGLDAARSNRVKGRHAWLKQYLGKVDYKVLDKVPTYHPDLVDDVHALSLEDASVDAYICTSVLQHVEEPAKAVRELYRTLAPGGYCFIYVPFIFYYHPMEGYYQDFWRFTDQGLKYLTRDFTSVELCPVRGPFATIANLIPFLSARNFGFLNWIDRKLKPDSKQVSGYYAFCTK